MGGFYHSFVPGGTGWLFMDLILALGVFALAIVVDRMYFISVRSNIDATKFMNEIHKLVLNSDYKRAIAMCKSAGRRALPKVINRALEEAERMEFVDFRTIQNTVDEAALEVIPRLTARTGWRTSWERFWNCRARRPPRLWISRPASSENVFSMRAQPS